MDDGTDVDPTGVIRHGQEVGRLLTGFQSGLEPAFAGLGESGALGVSGLPEASSVRTYHNALLQQVSSLIADVGTGVTALSQGALTIGANYLQADEDQRTEMTLAARAFAPGPGQPSLGAQQEQAAQQAAQQQAQQQSAVAAGRSPLPTPTDPTPEADETALDPSGYAEDVQEHEESYGEDEAEYDGQQVAPGEERPDRWGPLPRWVDGQLRQ